MRFMQKLMDIFKLESTRMSERTVHVAEDFREMSESKALSEIDRANRLADIANKTTDREEFYNATEEIESILSELSKYEHKFRESVNKLSDASNEVITFLDEVVLKDYDKLETLADNYKEDAQYYAEVSNVLGTHIESLSGSITDINEIIDTIDVSQKELDEAVRSVNGNLQIITSASEDVSEETKGIMKSVTSLQETVEQFNL